MAMVPLVADTALPESLLGSSKLRPRRPLEASLDTVMVDTLPMLLAWPLLVLREWVFLLRRLVCLLCTALLRRHLLPRTVLRLRLLPISPHRLLRLRERIVSPVRFVTVLKWIGIGFYGRSSENLIFETAVATVCCNQSLLNTVLSV